MWPGVPQATPEGASDSDDIEAGGPDGHSLVPSVAVTGSDDVEQLETSSSVALGARVLALVAAFAAVLALCLPWAQQAETKKVDGDLFLLRGGVEWTGWGLHAASTLNGQRPAGVACVVILAGGSLILLLGTWLAFERPRSDWLAKLMALLALVLVLGSLWATRDLHGTDAYADHDVITTGYGVTVWRIAVLAALFATVRHGVLMEQQGPKTRHTD